MSIPKPIENLIVSATPPGNTAVMWYDSSEKSLKAYKNNKWSRVHHIDIQSHNVKKIYRNTTLVFKDGFEVIKHGTLTHMSMSSPASLVYGAQHSLMANDILTLTGGEEYQLSVSGPTPNATTGAKIRVDVWLDTVNPVPVQTDPSKPDHGDVFHAEKPISISPTPKDHFTVKFTAQRTGDVRLTLVADGEIDPVDYTLVCSTKDDPNSNKIMIDRHFLIQRADPGTIRWSTEEPIHTLHFFHKTQTVWHTKPEPLNPVGPGNNLKAGGWYLLTDNAGIPVTLNGKARIDTVSTFAALGTASDVKIRVEALPKGIKPTPLSPGAKAITTVATAPNHGSTTGGTHIAAHRIGATRDWIDVNHAGAVNIFIWVYCSTAVSRMDPFTALSIVGDADQHPIIRAIPTFIKPVQEDIAIWHDGAVHVVYANDRKALHTDIHVQAIEDKGAFKRDYVFQNPFDVTINPALGYEITAVSIDGGNPVSTETKKPKPPKPPAKPGVPKATIDMNINLMSWSIDNMQANLWFLIHSHMPLPQPISSTNMHVPVAATGIHETALDDGAVAFAFEETQPVVQNIYMLVAKNHRWYLVSPPITFNDGPGNRLTDTPFLGVSDDPRIKFDHGLADFIQDKGFAIHFASGHIAAMPIWGSIAGYDIKSNIKLPPGMTWADLQKVYLGPTS